MSWIDPFAFLRGAFVFLEVLMVFNIIIIAHELGHFFAARWRGLKVDKFGVWFGPPIFSATFRGVKFSLGCVPAGGYVSIPQMANPELLEGAVETGLPEARPLDKIIVAIAGPVASIICGLVFSVIVWGVGKPVYEAETSTIIGYVEKGGGAERAGLKAGDRILTIGDKDITRFSGFSQMRNSAVWNIAKSEDGRVAISVDRNGEILDKVVTTAIPVNKTVGRKKLPQIGISPSTTPLILGTITGGPGEGAGIKKGDVILSINGEKVFSPIRVNEIIQEGNPLAIKLGRNGGMTKVDVTPREKSGTGEMVIGIEWDFESIKSIEHPNPLDQIRGAFLVMYETLGALFSPKSEIGAQHLSGPVGIMRLYYLLFEMPDGWRIALWFSVIFNINLAILNLLPIPVLDGGHILLATVEGLRRKKLNDKAVRYLQTACAVIILTFMLYVTGYDILDYVGEKILSQ